MTEFHAELFSQAMQGDKPVLVDFWAPWCVYCRRLAPAFEAVAREREGEILVGKVNVDEQPALSQTAKVELLPTLVVYRAGVEVDRIVAPQSKAAIDAFLQRALEG